MALEMCARRFARLRILLLEEAKEEAASCEMALMRVDAEAALAAIQADSEGGKRSSAIRLLNKLRRSTKLIGYRMRELELERMIASFAPHSGST